MLPSIGKEAATCSSIKNLHGRVTTTGGDNCTIGRPSHILGSLPMTMIGIDNPACIGIDDPNQCITARNGDALTIRGPGKTKVSHLISAGRDKVPCDAIPDLEDSVITAGSDMSAHRRPGNGKDTVGMAVINSNCLPSGSFPD